MGITRVSDLRLHRQAVSRVDIHREGCRDPVADLVAVEAPLEVRVNGQPLAVIMRTPGEERALALGFLLSEGLLRTGADLAGVDLSDAADVVNVRFTRGRADAVADALERRRHVTANTSCGVCGRRDLDSLRIDTAPLAFEWAIASGLVERLPGELGAAQSAFAATGGLHAAGVFDLDGCLIAAAEDVGRHNAVDKLLGAMLDAGGLPLARRVLFVSGRTSFEIVQKAWAGGIPLVAAVSAPTSLAIDLARVAGITLLGFVRGARFNVYTHPDRIAAA